VWGVDSSKGVLVERLAGSELTAQVGDIAEDGVTPGTAFQVLRTNSGATASEWGGVKIPSAGALTFSSNDAAPPTLVDGAHYKVPQTGAASTVTLPAAAATGTQAFFYADGALNDHTVQYRDETGPTNLTTALTANKLHMVHAMKTADGWVCTAYVSP